MKIHTLIPAALLFSFASSQAVTMATFNYDGLGANASSMPAPDVTMTIGAQALLGVTMASSGADAAGDAAFSGSSNAGFYRSSAAHGSHPVNPPGPGTVAGSIANNDYFNIIPTLGGTAGANNYSLDALELNYWVTSGFENRPYSVSLVGDLDGDGVFTAAEEITSIVGGTNSVDSGNAAGSGASGNSSTANLLQFDLSGVAALQDLSAGSAPELRLYFYDQTTSTGRIHRFDNVKITASIPEPSRALLAGLGLALALLRRRR